MGLGAWVGMSAGACLLPPRDPLAFNGLSPAMPAQGPGTIRSRGIDASFVPQYEAGAMVFRDALGNAGDPLVLLAAAGANVLRLRVWVNPLDGWCDTARTLSMAIRARALGYSILIDFHYSDSWADPGKQTPPVAWNGLNVDQMAQRVYEHTLDVMAGLRDQGTPPAMVQLGNEITDGMLWPSGRLSTGGRANLASYLAAGRRAVLDASRGRPPRIMLHIDRGGDNATSRWFFDQMRDAGVIYDVIGLSYYPWWHGSMASMTANIQDLASRYGRPIWLVETAYPWTLSYKDAQNNFVWQPSQLLPGYAASPAGQRAFLLALQDALAALPDGLGEGLCYWAPEYVAGPALPSPWENLALFDFNNRLLMSADALRGRTRIGRTSR